jgi:hypothetical protein
VEREKDPLITLITQRKSVQSVQSVEKKISVIGEICGEKKAIRGERIK